MTTTPRIYVACLAAYSQGDLHGAWIDANQEAWGIWDGIKAMLERSPVAGAEEFAIHDYEGFEPVRIAEYEGIERVAEIATFLCEHGDVGAQVLAYLGDELGEAREAMTDRYLGSYPSLADHLQEMTESAIEIPEALRFYVDWEAMARDAQMSGSFFTIETGYQEVHVFAAC